MGVGGIEISKMKERDLIREVLEEFEDSQINMGSAMAREILAHKIWKNLDKHYHLTLKENEKHGIIEKGL
jgi:hypothetical protein